MVVACLLASRGADLPGQVQFAGSADDAAAVNRSPVRVNPFRTPTNTRQVQFQELPPQVPSAEQEAAVPGRIGSNSSVSGETIYGLETIPPDRQATTST